MQSSSVFINGKEFLVGLKWRILENHGASAFIKDVNFLAGEVGSTRHGVFDEFPINGEVTPQVGLFLGEEAPESLPALAPYFVEKYPNNYIFLELESVKEPGSDSDSNFGSDSLFWFCVIEDGFINPTTDILGTKDEVLLHYSNIVHEDEQYVESLNTLLYDSHKTLRIATNGAETLLLDEESDVQMLDLGILNSKNKKWQVSDLSINPAVKYTKAGIAFLALTLPIAIYFSFFFSESDKDALIQAVDPAVQQKIAYDAQLNSYLTEIGAYQYLPGFNKPNDNLKKVLNRFNLTHDNWRLQSAECDIDECIIKYYSTISSSGLNLQKAYSLDDKSLVIGPKGENATIILKTPSAPADSALTYNTLKELGGYRDFVGRLFDEAAVFRSFYENFTWTIYQPKDVSFSTTHPDPGHPASFALVPVSLGGKSISQLDIIPSLLSKPLGLYNISSELTVDAKGEVKYIGHYEHAVK
jgi:hypothetical protein